MRVIWTFFAMFFGITLTVSSFVGVVWLINDFEFSDAWVFGTLSIMVVSMFFTAVITSLEVEDD